MSAVDTTPGAECVLAPAPGTHPTMAEYRALMRERYRFNIGARQHMHIFAWRLCARPYHRATEILGDYAAEARAILEAIATRGPTC